MDLRDDLLARAARISAGLLASGPDALRHQPQLHDFVLGGLLFGGRSFGVFAVGASWLAASVRARDRLSALEESQRDDPVRAHVRRAPSTRHMYSSTRCVRRRVRSPTERRVRVMVGRSGLGVGVAVALLALVLLVVPLNGTLDVVKPCGEQLACSVPRYRSLFLSLADLDAPFNGLNRDSVPVLVAAAAILGWGSARLVGLRGGRRRG